MVENSIPLELYVPIEPTRRVNMAAMAQEVINSSNSCAPVSLGALEDLGQQVIIKAEGDPKELAFAMLICSNELWRPYFEATPTNRRLLLLPKCLRHSTGCNASSDSLGLLCAACNSCSIRSILSLAEGLGYSTIVAEGTSKAIALVEQGHADAIIGVGCMEALRESFSSITSIAIPALAIPLSEAGCTNTQVDFEWLLSSITRYNPNNQLCPISIPNLKTDVKSIFEEGFIKRMLGTNEKPTTTEEIAIEIILSGGKRMRPLMGLLAYSSYTSTFNRELANGLAFALECFHKASLVHDDIQDDDDFRYKKRTAHKRIGVPMAINLGDYLIGQGYSALSRLKVSSLTVANIFKLFASNHVCSTIGQGVDLSVNQTNMCISTEEMLNVFDQKTSSSIRVSLLSGAMLGGATDSELILVERFASLFGVAYQIRDDLNEYRGEATDQVQFSFPLLQCIAMEKISQRPSENYGWQKIIEQTDAVIIAENLLQNHLRRMNTVINSIKNHRLRFALTNLTHKVFYSNE